MFGSMQLDTYYKGHSKNFFFRVAIKKLMRVPRVLVYNFLFNHLFDGILRNWSFGLAKINKYLLQMGVNLGRDMLFFLKFFGLICVVYLIIWANWIYLGNFLFNLQLAKILDGQILQLNFFFFFRVVNNFFQGGPQPM